MIKKILLALVVSVFSISSLAEDGYSCKTISSGMFQFFDKDELCSLTQVCPSYKGSKGLLLYCLAETKEECTKSKSWLTPYQFYGIQDGLKIKKLMRAPARDEGKDKIGFCAVY